MNKGGTKQDKDRIKKELEHRKVFSNKQHKISSNHEVTKLERLNEQEKEKKTYK